MPRLFPCFSLAILAASGLAADRVEARGCEASAPIWNPHYGNPEAGGFDLQGTSFSGKASPGPSIRFWAFGAFEKANSGTQEQFTPETLWIANPSADDKMKERPAGLWSLWQANWVGPNVNGCIQLVPEPRRTVVEVSFANPAGEGTTAHRGFFAISSVPFSNSMSSYDFDEVRGGTGVKGNIVPTQAIPVPRVVGAPRELKAGGLEVSVELPEPVSYSEGGKDAPVKLVRGYRIVYATGAEPTSSDPAKWTPVRDPKTGKELSLVKPGTTQVALPGGAKGLWLAAQLVFEDPSPVLSRATSAHVAVSGKSTGTKASAPASDEAGKPARTR